MSSQDAVCVGRQAGGARRVALRRSQACGHWVGSRACAPSAVAWCWRAQRSCWADGAGAAGLGPITALGMGARDDLAVSARGPGQGSCRRIPCTRRKSASCFASRRMRVSFYDDSRIFFPKLKSCTARFLKSSQFVRLQPTGQVESACGARATPPLARSRDRVACPSASQRSKTRRRTPWLWQLPTQSRHR